MTASFSTAEALQRQFHDTSIILATMVLALAVGGVLDSRRRSPTLSFSSVCTVAAAALVGVIAFSHWSAYDQFVQAEVTRADVKLLYVGRFGKQVVVTHEEVETIRFGSIGKSNQGCYIRILLKSGDSYRSATLNNQLDTCKSLRVQMLTALSAA